MGILSVYSSRDHSLAGNFCFSVTSGLDTDWKNAQSYSTSRGFLKNLWYILNLYLIDVGTNEGQDFLLSQRNKNHPRISKYTSMP
jgi:hypothetical protein